MTDLELGSTEVSESVDHPYSLGYKPTSLEDMIRGYGDIFNIDEREVERALRNAEEISGQNVSLPDGSRLTAVPHLTGEPYEHLSATVIKALGLGGTRGVIHTKNFQVNRAKKTGSVLDLIQRNQRSTKILILPISTTHDHLHASPQGKWGKINLGLLQVGAILTVDPGRLMNPSDPPIMCPGDQVSQTKTSGPKTTVIFHPCFSVDEQNRLVVDCRPSSSSYSEAVGFYQIKKRK